MRVIVRVVRVTAARSPLSPRFQTHRLAQRSDHAFGRPGPSPRCADPRNGCRGRLRASRCPARRCTSTLIPAPPIPTTEEANPKQPATDRSRSPCDQAPVVWPYWLPTKITSSAKSAIVSSFSGQPGGSRLYSHSFLALDPQSGGPGLEVRVALRRGAVVNGRVVGPDDKPVAEAWVISSAALGPSAPAWRFWQANYHGTARGGRFELHGLAQETEIPVFFFDPKAKLGAVAHLSGKMASGGPITIRLQPCGTAVARLVDSEQTSGRPLRRRVPDLDDHHARTGPSEPERRRREAPLRPSRSPLPDRPDQLRTRSDVRHRRTHCVPRTDSGCVVSNPLAPGPPPTFRPSCPEILHGQARRNRRPGRHPDRETTGSMNPLPPGRGWPQAG